MSEAFEKIKTFCGNSLISSNDDRAEETIIIAAVDLKKTLRFLKNDELLDFNLLVDLTAVDCLRLGAGHRFEMVYQLYSLKKKHSVRVKVPLQGPEDSVPTISDLWPSANWLEREVWDMFGIRFDDHPNLTRILMYEEFKGHPLRKDYPVNHRQPLIGPGSANV